MSYLGNTPAARFSAMAKQTITGDGTASYTLDHAVGNEQEIEVFVNNVRQEPGSGKAYTVSGTALTMTGNVASTDDFYVVFQGKAQQTVRHPANTALEATTGTFSGALSATTGTFSGAVSMGANNITFSDGNGIDFSASAGSGASSSILDDYEEGTWTPAYSTSGGSFSYDTATQGQYTKIGNVVTVYFRIYTNSATVGTGDVSITGLPFAEAIPSGFGGGSISDCREFVGDTPSEIGVYNSEILLWYRTSANGPNTRLQASDLGTGSVDNLIDGQITYITS